MKINLKDIRVRKGLTQADIAQALGISQGSVSNIEKHTQAVSLTRLAELAGVLNCNIYELLPADVSPTANNNHSIND